jgi:choline dehydrogenase-like flavoprotein
VTDWCFSAEPNPRLNDRRLHLAMGKGLGGGSSMNGMMWARGHRRDWDLLAVATGDPGWSYNSLLKIYRRIERQDCRWGSSLTPTSLFLLVTRKLTPSRIR